MRVPDIFSRPRLFALEELLSRSLLIFCTGNTDDMLSLIDKKIIGIGTIMVSVELDSYMVVGTWRLGSGLDKVIRIQKRHYRVVHI